MPQAALKLAVQRIKARPKLDIGCGAQAHPAGEGWINCDLYPGPGVDKVFDAEKDRWPFNDESVSLVSSSHVLEHIADPMAYFREAWRVLEPQGQLWLRLPYGWHQSAWWDLTHLRPWVQESFAILQPGYTNFTRNSQHNDMGFAFWVTNCALVLDKPWSRMWRFKPLRRLVMFAGRHCLNVYRDLIVDAYKTTKDDPTSVAYGGTRHPAIVPCSFAVYKHEYYNRSNAGLKGYELIVFTGHEGIGGEG